MGLKIIGNDIVNTSTTTDVIFKDSGNAAIFRIGTDGSLKKGDGSPISIAWTQLTGVPTTFNPSAHTHAIADVTGLQGALDLKAPIASPTFTGTPSAPTPIAGTNTTQLATTAFVSTAISNLVDSSPLTLDTLNELAAALGDDPNFATTVSTALGNRLRIDINNQGLTTTQQANGRTNLGLGTAATANVGDFATSANLANYLPLAGGTMTGNIQMSGNALQFDQSGVRSWSVQASGGNGQLNITSGDGLGAVAIHNQKVFNTTTPGTTTYGLHFDSQNTADYATGITWNGASTGAQAGIYVQGAGTYGTKMYFATTDAYAAGAKTGFDMDHTGLVIFRRARPQYQSNVMLDAGNYNSYAPTLTGTGATGTWGISITGNAATVTNGVYTTGSYADPTWLTSLALSKLTGADDLKAIEVLVGSGLLRKAGSNTWTLDTSTYLTGNQTITLSGDATGSGTTSIAVTLANSGVSAGTYTKVTVDAKGRVTSGSTLTASDIPALMLDNLPDAWTKRSVRVATTANITLSGTQTIDGIAVVAGDRVLVKDQSTASQNGIYIVAAGTWSRSADADTISKLAGSVVAVDSGTTNGGLRFDTDLKSTDTLGTTNVVFSRIVDTAYTIPVSQGGTGSTTLTGILVGNGSSAVSAVAGSANQLLRRNAGNTAYEFFTPTYLTANQTITLSGAVTGSGSTSITTSYTGIVGTFNSLANASGFLKNNGSGTLSYVTDNSTDWNTAYSKRILSAAVTGTTSKTLTLTLGDATTVVATWSDIDTAEADTLATVTARGATTSTNIAVNGVRLGRDFSLANRATVRLDANGDFPADILFGRTAAANETGWTGVYWSLSSRGTADSNEFRLYRGTSNTGGAELVVLAVTPSGNITVSGTISASNFSGSSSGTNTGDQTTITGNAGSATVLQTARTLTIGSTGKAFNGSANVSWSLAEIGAAATSHTHTTSNITDLSSYTGFDTRYVNVTGDTMTGNLIVSGASLGVVSTVSGSEAFYIDGVNGRLFTITDDLSDSLFSVNTIAGLPVIEAFADNSVKLGPFSNPITVNSTGSISMGTAGTSYIRMGRFASGVNNTGEAWIGRASDRSIGTMTVQLGVDSARVFEVVNNAWSQVIFSAGMDTFQYKGNGILHGGNYTNFAPSLTGSGASGTWGISITGNAGSATVLQTARTINGTSFNGSANITTSSWGTARTITIGSTGKSVDGSANVSWSLAEIGAYAATNPSGYISSYTETDTLATVTARGASTSTALTLGGNVRMQADMGFDAGKTLYFGYEEGFGGTDFGGIDYGYITFDNNSSTYGSGAGETSVLRIGTSNDGAGGNSDSIAIEAAADIYLRPGAMGGTGTIRVGTYSSYSTVWHSGNDGVGSGLDADLLDGQHGSYYQPASTAITTSNIGSQSVNYATSAGSANSAGYATSAGNTNNIDGVAFTNTNSGSATNPDTIGTNGISYTLVSLLGQSDGALYSQAYSSAWQHQIFGDYRTGQIALRGRNNGTWQSWRTVLDSSNYNSYSPTLTGSGASGTWSINIAGNIESDSIVFGTGSLGTFEFNHGTAGGENNDFVMNNPYQTWIFRANETTTLEIIAGSFTRMTLSAAGVITFNGSSNIVLNTTNGAISGASLTTTGAVSGGSLTTAGTVTGVSATFSGTAPLTFSGAGSSGNALSLIYNNTTNGFLVDIANTITGAGVAGMIVKQRGQAQVALYVDVNTQTNSIKGRVGVRTTSPLSVVDISGSFAANIRANLTGNQTIQDDDHTVENVGGAVTYTLPAASTCTRRIYCIINHGTGAITTSIAYRTANGSTTTTIAAGSRIMIQSDGSEWLLIAN